MNPSQELLLWLRADPRWQEIMKELEALRPVVPNYNWQTDNKNEVTSKMLLQQGFDLALQKLKH